MAEPRPPAGPPGEIGGAGGGAGPPRAGGDPAERLRLPAATALVIGNIVGVGIFLLPAALAGYGTLSILTFFIVSVGAIAMALVFGKLGARLPAGGGPYVYSRQAFGEFVGFWNAWSFWLTAWIGNAGIAVAWAGYVNYFLSWDNVWGKIFLTLVGLWIPVWINLGGVRSIGRFQLITTVLKFVPLIFIGIFGLFFVSSANFGPFNASELPPLTAMSAAGALALFAFSGLESSTIAADRIEDPERNIGKASIYGCLACAALYLLSTIAVFGNVPHDRLERSTAPFADAVNNMFGGGFWGGVVALCAVVSGIGALNGWTMLMAEMPRAAARDGVFPRFFTLESSRGAPWTGIVLGTVLASFIAIWSYVTSANAFNTILLIATFTTVIPYFFSACAHLYWLVTGGSPTPPGVNVVRMSEDLVIAVIAVLFSFWMAYGSGRDAITAGFLMMLVGVPVYIWVKAAHHEFGPEHGPGPAAGTPPPE
jgi:APA family basic amino acid/polyamine antiporter